MELEELKSKWLALDQQMEKQKMLNVTIIRKMTAYRSHSILTPLVNFEKFGMIISSAMLLYIFFNVGKLNDWLAVAGAVGTILILSAGLVMSVLLIKKIRKVDIVHGTYRDTLLNVNKVKKAQHRFKWIGIMAAPVLVFSILPALAATWFDKSLLADLEEYWESLVPAFVLIPFILYFISRFEARKIKELDELMREFGDE